MNAIILGGDPSITGNFTQETSKTLADQLKYGALPLSFTVQSSNSISATLGSQQLAIGVIAGLIGLVLVAIYSLIVYRALGFIIIASLAVMGVLTYLTLSHPGLAHGLPPVARRRRRPHRDDRLHGRLVHRLLRAHPRRTPRRQVDHGRRRGRLGSREAHDLHLEVDQHPRGRGALHPRGCHREGLRVHARSHDRDRRAHLHPLHPPGAAAAGADEVLRLGASALGSRPGRARCRLPRTRAVPRAGRRRHHDGRRPQDRQVARRSGTPSDDRRAQAGRELAAATTRQIANPARPPRRETTDGALHEPVRQRPLHRQDLLPLRRTSKPVVPHRRDPRDRLGAGPALPPDPVLDRVHRRIAVHRERCREHRPGDRDRGRAVRRPRRDDEGRDGRHRHRARADQSDDGCRDPRGHGRPRRGLRRARPTRSARRSSAPAGAPT